MKTISLDSYRVLVGDVNAALSSILDQRKYSRIGILVDENTSIHCYPLIQYQFGQSESILIQSGEVNKNISTCEVIWNEMQKNKYDRHSLLINLGGGVIGDMGGFAASCYMRGIDFIQIPTTLLAQVDASVGGKLGVDFQGYKNFIGLFNDPIGVIADPSFFKTLPHRELRSGFAEMIKHALIMDSATWKRFVTCNEWKDCISTEEIYSSIEIKQKVVLQDPYESGLRKILNFGHTIGHAVETQALGGKNHLLHGEAIAIGMIAETLLSTMKAGLSDSEARIILDYIRRVYSDIGITDSSDTSAIIDLMTADKKNKGGKIMMSLLTEIGNCTYDVEVSQAELRQVIESTREFLE